MGRCGVGLGLVCLALSAPQAAAAADFATAPRPCGQAKYGRALPPMFVAPASPPPGPGLAKGERDPLGVPNSLASTNFRLLWGNAAPVEPADAQRILDALEHAWTVEIEQLGFPAPARTDEWLLNVYAGGSGDGAPPSNGVAGYATFDDEGHHMLVIAQDLIADDDPYVEGTAAHEFFHAVQASTARYPYDGISAWLWEATAAWVQYQVNPAYPDYATFLFGYVYLPHHSLNAFDYFDTGALVEYHQYGAFIFPHYVTQQVADPSIVRDLWIDDGTEPDPLVVMADLLAEQGHDFHEVWLDHLAHDVLWDYEDHDNLLDYATRYDAMWEESTNVIIAEVPPEGTGGFALAPEDTLPRRLGSNAWRMAAPPAGNLRVQVHGVVDSDSDDVPATWGARIVREYADHVEYLPVPFTLEDYWEADFLLEGVGDENAVYLVVGVWTDEPVSPTAWSTGTYAYELAITPEEPATADTTGGSSSTGADETSSSSTTDAESTGAPAEGTESGSESSSSGAAAGAGDDGCGCASEPSRGGALALLLALGLRRRRAQQKSSSEPSPQS